MNNKKTTFTSTAAASIIFAAMISMINDNRIKKGLSAVGFINPAIYAFYSDFSKDVVSGNNYCTSLSSVCCNVGFEAAVGWVISLSFHLIRRMLLMFYHFL